jgi:peroxygenase
MGFRALGFTTLYVKNMFAPATLSECNGRLALNSALAFHILHVSYATSPTWIPDLRFPVYVKNIHWAKHGSDTETFDTEGRFVPQKFEEIFSKYDRSVDSYDPHAAIANAADSDDKGGLYFTDLVNMWRGNRGVLDVIGWVFQLFLWTFLFALAARRPGPEESGDRNREVLWKQDVLAQYDGSLYYEIEARRKKGQSLPWYRGGQWFGII